jgi:hypothetical protein
VLQKPQKIFRPKVSIVQTENPKEQRDKERAERRESREKREQREEEREKISEEMRGEREIFGTKGRW